MKKIVVLFFIFCSFMFAKTLDANVVDKLSLEKNRLYIISFFASWCKSCEKELPLIVELNKSIKNKNIEIVGVSMDENLQKTKNFQKKLKINFRVFNDTKQNIVSIFDPQGVPAIYYVKNNEILSARFGAKDDIDKVILEDIKPYIKN